MQGGGREGEKLEPTVQGGEEEIPSEVKSQTRQGGTTDHWLPHSCEQESPGTREHCSKSCAIFYPKIRVRCQI